MAEPTIEQQIQQQLERMPPDLQRRVLDFAQALAQSRPRGEAGKALPRFAGLLDTDSAQAMQEAIEAEWGR